MLGVVFWSSLRFGLKPLALWGICCWHDTPGREMEQLRVLEEGCGDKENYLVWERCCGLNPTPTRSGFLSVSQEGKRLMFKDQSKVEVREKRLPRFSHTCLWPRGGGCRWLAGRSALGC